MHPIDIESTLKTMVITVDSRERPTEQAKRRYSEFGCPWEQHKLNFGDYSCAVKLPNGETKSFENDFCVERKLGLQEVCTCFTYERDRFTREFERAKAVNAKIVLLIEEASWEKAYNGKYRSQMKPQALVASMLAWLARYDCQIIMCRAETSGRLIKDILYREAKERLTNMEVIE
jgi:ERCC4-type nuclease